MTDPSSGPAGPSDVPGLVPAAVPGSGPVSERMRALLSKAVDEQVQEQRAVSSVLQDLRGQVTGLSEALSRTASGAGVERVAADVERARRRPALGHAPRWAPGSRPSAAGSTSRPRR